MVDDKRQAGTEIEITEEMIAVASDAIDRVFDVDRLALESAMRTALVVALQAKHPRQ